MHSSCALLICAINKEINKLLQWIHNCMITLCNFKYCIYVTSSTQLIIVTHNNKAMCMTHTWIWPWELSTVADCRATSLSDSISKAVPQKGMNQEVTGVVLYMVCRTVWWLVLISEEKWSNECLHYQFSQLLNWSFPFPSSKPSKLAKPVIFNATPEHALAPTLQGNLQLHSHSSSRSGKQMSCSKDFANSTPVPLSWTDAVL